MSIVVIPHGLDQAGVGEVEEKKVAGHLEPLSALLRVGGGYGEPYTWSATVRYLCPTAIEILGAVRAPTREEWRAAVSTCRDADIVDLWFTRRRAGIERTHRVRTGRRSHS